MSKKPYLTSWLHILYSISKPQNVFISLVTFVLLLNTAQLGRELRKMEQSREKMPYIFMGIKFSGLKDILKNISHMGYYTDKDMDNRVDALQFAQAQYTLAPIILDFNNTNYEYILFDCSKEEIALEKMLQIGAIPVRKNQFGVILARNLKAKSLK